jgi:DNA-directed RNA polymerase subunit alpha
MQPIAFPKKINFIDSEEPNRGQVIIEPCYPGFGTTLGNSIRRVLISSLPGAAVVGVKIHGADHEFTSLPHIKEDILEIALNLKMLRLKVFEEGVIKLELEAHGEKVATAGDIIKNHQVEIVNPELVIANITEMSGNLKMDIFVSQGRGYEMIENKETKSKEIGYIEMDSIFSPILSTGINIENVRVGKITNWDKLILDILTDGTISYKEAFENATKILIAQFKSILSIEENEKEEKREQEEKDTASAENMEREDNIKSEMSAEANLSDESSDVDSDEPKKRRGRPKKINE